MKHMNELAGDSTETRVMHDVSCFRANELWEESV
jgi:hypothetical protein